MTALVALSYQGLTVDFNEDGWFNATAPAAHYGKRVADWLENRDTQSYMMVLADVLEVPKKALLKVKRGGRGKPDSTWFHPKLAVPFARWLDVRFAVWCDIQIDGLLKGQHPHFDWKRARSEAASSFKVMNDALKLVREEQGKVTASHHFINEARLVNGVLTRQFSALDREQLSEPDLALLAHLEVRNSVLIGRGLDYKARKLILQQAALDLRPTATAFPKDRAA